MSVMRTTQLVYTTAATDRRDFTAEIAAADSPEDQRKLLDRG